MQVSSATSPRPAEAFQPAQAAHPPDAGGDNDGTRPAVRVAEPAPPMASAGKPGSGLREVARHADRCRARPNDCFLALSRRWPN